MGIFNRLTHKGGVLTGHEINKQIREGRIYISDYDPNALNPNSYNLRCGDSVKVYRNITMIDLKDETTFSNTETFKIDPDEGFILRPGMLYLVPTKEMVKTDYYEPIITGRSSIGRLGIAVHQEAGFGDIGFGGVWTLQIKVTYPTKIYPNLPIAQVYFLTPHGKIDTLYKGKYQGAVDSVSSKPDN